MEAQPEPLPQDDKDSQKWQRGFAENNQKTQALMAEAIRLPEERTQQYNVTKTY